MPVIHGQAPTTIRHGVFALACGASFLLYLHRYAWNLIGPTLQQDYGLTNTQAGFLFSLFYYTYAGLQIPSGLVIDRFGPHCFLAMIIVAWSCAVAALGFTSSLLIMGLLRLVFGAAQAGCYPALNKVTHSWFPLASRTMVQGWVATTAGRAGGALSPIVMGTLLMGGLGLSWQSSLLVLGLLGAVYGLLFFLCFRDSPAQHPGVNDAEIALIHGGSSVAPDSHRATLPVRIALRSVPLRFFVVQQFLDAGSDIVFVSLIGTYFLRARGFDISKTGWMASLPLLGGALGGIAGGWLNDALIRRTGSRRWARSGVGFVGKFIGCLMLGLVAGQQSGVAAAWVLLVAKFFSDWSQPTVWGSCTDLAGRFSATVFSIINTAGTLGAVAMPIVFGRVLDFYTHRSVSGSTQIETTDWTPLFALLAAMYLASGICWLLIDCTRTIDPEPENAVSSDHSPDQ